MSIIDAANHVVACAEPTAEADTAARRLILSVSTDLASMLLTRMGVPPYPEHLAGVAEQLGWVLAGSVGRTQADMLRTLTWTSRMLGRLYSHVDAGDRDAPGWQWEWRVYESMRVRHNAAIEQCRIAGWEGV